MSLSLWGQRQKSTKSTARNCWIFFEGVSSTSGQMQKQSIETFLFGGLQLLPQKVSNFWSYKIVAKNSIARSYSYHWCVFCACIYIYFFLIYLFKLCVYVFYLYIYIYLLKYVHQHLGLDFYILGSKEMFIPYHLFMGLRVEWDTRYKIADSQKIPVDLSSMRRCLAEGVVSENVSGWWRMGVLLWSKTYWFHWCFA